MGIILSLAFPRPEPTYEERDRGLIVVGESQKEGVVCMHLKDRASLAPPKRTFIYFHGNAEDVGTAEYFLEGILRESDGQAFCVEYPTYGTYKWGKISEERIRNDSLRVYDYLHKELNYDSKKTFIIGKSIGGGPATYLASQRDNAGLILISPFKSLDCVVSKLIRPDILSLVLSFLSFMVSWRRIKSEKMRRISMGSSLVVPPLILYSIVHPFRKFRNIEFMERMKTPVLFIHGKRDELIPFSHSEEMFQKCGSFKKRLELREGMTHNNFNLKRDIEEPILKFISSE